LQQPLFLYDVTSSYFEGEHNDLAELGYNRDKKKVVAELLCDEDGYPLSIELFESNILDYQTFGNQIKKVVDKFKCEYLTFTGGS
jgi:transposase